MAARSCWTFIFKVATQIMCVGRHNLLQGHAVTLTFKVTTKMCVQHVVSIWWSFLCNIFKSLKSHFKYRSYAPETIMMQGHAVTLTLTFKVATQICARHLVLIWWSILWISFKHEFGAHRRTDWLTDGRTTRDYMLPRNFSGSIKISYTQ